MISTATWSPASLARDRCPIRAQPGGSLQRVAAGGAAALAGLVQCAAPGRAAQRAGVSTGDMVGAAPLVSALFRHESTVEVLNQLGVDVAARRQP